MNKNTRQCDVVRTSLDHRTREACYIIYIFQRLLRLPVASDWERFDYYAPRIRRLGISRFRERNHDLRISCGAVFDLLSRYRTFSLPNLWHCQLDLTRHHSRIYRLSLGPALTNLKVRAVSYDESTFINLCSDILSMAPKIQHLSGKFYPISESSAALPRADAPIFTLICGLRGLRSINLPKVRIPQSILAHLTTHSSLTSLGIYIPSSDVDVFTVLRLSNLKEFYLTADSWSSITSILSSTVNCTFTALSVCCLDMESEPLSDLRTLLTILRSSFGSLSNIHLESRKFFFDSFDVGMTEVRDTIHPLLSCKQLQAITLNFAFLEVLDDSWLLEASSVWPLLESFRIDFCEGEKSRMTLSGLNSLVQKLPRLQDIKLPLSLSEADASMLGDFITGNIHDLRIRHSRLPFDCRSRNKNFQACTDTCTFLGIPERGVEVLNRD
jgi:hypothetical protein